MSSKKRRHLDQASVPAYRHGFFAALVAGPLTTSAEWIDLLLPRISFKTVDSLNRAMAEAVDEYNSVAEELLQRPHEFVDRVVTLCGSSGDALLEWYHGFSHALGLRLAEWKGFVATDTGADIFLPLSLLADIDGKPEKRAWLQDAQLRENLSKAVGVAVVRIFEGWRARDGAASTRPPQRSRRRQHGAAQHRGHPWTFRARLRRGAFGWRSSRLAITRLNEGLREIRKAAKTDPALAGEGAVLLFERISPAFEQVDSSSGALGTAVYRTVEELAGVVAAAPIDRVTRIRWLERLWQACVDDGMGYLDNMERLWGEVCATREIASWWADESLSNVRAHWQRPRRERGYLTGSIACLSALFKAERYRDILDLLSLDEGSSFWPYREWGFRALVAMGRRAEALRWAEASDDINSGPQIARACEDLLLSSGMADEAYERYAFRAMREETTYAGTFRSMCKRYPQKSPRVILRDLAASTPGSEGKWFAAAKDAGLYDEALRLANTSPCDPLTLSRAARDFADELPEFAMEASAASLRWMAEGYGYELTSLDVIRAYQAGLKAAQRLGCESPFMHRAKVLVESGHPIVREALSRELGLPRLPQPAATRRPKPRSRRNA